MVIYYKKDKTVKRLTLITTALLALGVAAIWLWVGDAYLRAWIVAMLAAVVLLFILSIPRKVQLTDGLLEIKCVVELTRIAVEDIRSVRKIDYEEIAPLIPLLGSYGFFGYYGYYADVQSWDILKIYATEWRNLVLIEDIYETKFLISCREADELIAEIDKA